MTEEFKSSITSDKVETDNRNFATVKADQTCEEALIPREDAFRQLNWQVTLEKGSVYKPQDDVGIYAQEIDCKYGVQIGSDIFGRDSISLAHGGAVHSAVGDAEEKPVVGTRILGTVASEGSVEVVEPTSKAADWEDRPVTVYGDVLGSHVTINEPLVVYGNLVAEQTIRVDAPTVVLGEVHSQGSLEATDLFALTISAHDDIILGKRVATVNPVVRSTDGEITIADAVGLLDSTTLAEIQAEHDLDRLSLGPWLFDEELLWESSRLLPEDITSTESGAVASRAWRTITEPDEEYAFIQSLIETQVEVFRNDPPDIEQFRYAGLSSLEEMGSGAGVTIAHDGEGDIVMGAQEKTVQEESYTEIDQSQTEIDQSTDVHDESTTVEDSVVNRSDIGGETESNETETDAEE